jgi:hypothetical protein
LKKEIITNLVNLDEVRESLEQKMRASWKVSYGKQRCLNKVVEIANSELNLNKSNSVQIFTSPDKESDCIVTFQEAWEYCKFKNLKDHKELQDLMQPEKQRLRKPRVSHFDLSYFDFTSYLDDKNVESVVDFVSNHHFVHKGKKPHITAISVNSNTGETHSTCTKNLIELKKTLKENVHFYEGEEPCYDHETAANLISKKVRNKIKRTRRTTILHYETYKNHEDTSEMFFFIILFEKY